MTRIPSVGTDPDRDRTRSSRLGTLGRLAVLTLLLPALAVPAAVAPSLLASPVAAAAPSGSGGTAFLRGAHLSPDTGSVDVYLTAFSGGTTTLWLSKVGYGDVSGYRRIPAGTYAVSMRPHGAAASSAPVLSWSIDLSAGHAYTALAIGFNASLRGTIVGDTLSSPSAGEGLVRVVQASGRAGRVDVSAQGGRALASDVAFGTITPYAPTRAGTWKVDVTSASTGAMIGSLPVTVRSGSITSVVVLDDKAGSGVRVTALLDAAGAPTQPSGAVPAGGGGTARNVVGSPSDPTVRTIVVGTGALLLVVGLLMLGRAVLVTRRRADPRETQFSTR